MKRPTPGKKYLFKPVGWDVFDKRNNTPEDGEIVTAIKSPYGTPPSGTMGHTYVEGSKGMALVLVNSLQPVSGGKSGARLVMTERGTTLKQGKRESRRVVLKGGRFHVAREMADAGIPFAFVKEAGPNTVGDISADYVDKLSAYLEKHPELEGRFAKA